MVIGECLPRASLREDRTGAPEEEWSKVRPCGTSPAAHRGNANPKRSPRFECQSIDGSESGSKKIGTAYHLSVPHICIYNGEVIMKVND